MPSCFCVYLSFFYFNEARLPHLLFLKYICFQRNEKKIAEEFVKEEEMNARLEEEARNRMAENMTQRVIPMDDVDDEEKWDS